MKQTPAQLAATKRYRESHRDALREYQRAYNLAHRESRAEYLREYGKEHRVALNASRREYNGDHRDVINARQREYNATVRSGRRNDRKHFLNLMKAGVGCADCGETELLHFHHRDKSTKSFNVSEQILLPWSELMTEIWKCDVLCNPCHGKRHGAENRCLVG